MDLSRNSVKVKLNPNINSGNRWFYLMLAASWVQLLHSEQLSFVVTSCRGSRLKRDGYRDARY